MDPITMAIAGTIASKVIEVLGDPLVKLVLRNWREILSWFKKIFLGIIDIFTTSGAGLYYAVNAYIELLGEKLATLRNKVLYQEDYYYVEEIRESDVDVDQLPPWARQRAALGEESEITNEVRRELGLEL